MTFKYKKESCLWKVECFLSKGEPIEKKNRLQDE